MAVYESKLFLLWLLTLPFYQFSVFGTISLDNILIPVLLIVFFVHLLLSGFSSFHDNKKKIHVNLFILTCLSIYLSGHLLKLSLSTEIFWGRAWHLTKIIGYFFLPLLFTNSLSYLKKINSLIIIVCLIGSLSAFLAAVGLIELDVTRFSESRIGEEWLPKSIGLFAAYGELAHLITYTLLLTISQRKEEFLFGRGYLPVKILVIIIILLGIVGTQSRNIILSSVVGIITYGYLKLIDVKRAKNRTVSTFVGIFYLLMISSLTLALFGSDLVLFFKNIGGQDAQATASVRLESYKVAWEMIKEAPILGVSAEVYRKHYEFINGVHNIWLGVALQGGIISIIGMLTLMSSALVLTFQRVVKGDLARQAQISVAFAVSLFITSLFYIAHDAHLFWIMLAVTLSVSFIPADKGMSTQDSTV